MHFVYNLGPDQLGHLCSINWAFSVSLLLIHRFLTAVVRASLGSCVKAKFYLRMVSWFFPGFSGFRPPLLKDLLNISEIFLKGL